MQLIELLNALRPSGTNGFEGLVRELLQNLTGYRFDLARSGSQGGRDIGGRLKDSFVAVECKRYSNTTSFDDHQLLGSMEHSARSSRNLGLWILASTREVPDQLLAELEVCAARLGIDFAVLSAHGDGHSELLTLCAQFPETFLRFFELDAEQSAAISAELDAVRSSLLFSDSLQRLSDSLKPSNWGFDRWRTRQNDWTASRFTSEVLSRAAFSQPLDVASGRESVIQRTEAFGQLDEWWSTWQQGKSRFALLGQEGDGKSWAIASWLRGKLRTDDSFPPVVFVTSTAAGEREPLDLIAETVRTQLNDTDPDWTRRLQRWLSGRPAPVMLLVLDGINEGARPPEYWIHLLQRLADPGLGARIAVVVTCRPMSWNSSFGQLRSLNFDEWELQPFSTDEIAPALLEAGIKDADIAPAMRDLVRKPRYLQLVIKHHARLNETGDFTVPRLVYEDWRERWSRKTGLADPSAFEQMIKDLARKYRDAKPHVTLQEVEAALPSWTTPSATVRELVETGVLKPQSGRFVVDHTQLVLGLGLLLADDLMSATNRGGDPEEAIASWLEPHSDIDLKAQVTEFAALAALQTDGYPPQSTTSLLYSWLRNRNREHESQSRFVGYFLLNPAAYARLAEHVWRQGDDVRAVQDLMMATFSRWLESPSALSHFRSIFSRWLGFVHPLGVLGGNAEGEAKQRQLAQFDRLASEARLHLDGSLQVSRHTLLRVEEPELLRLGRFALAVISRLDRGMFLEALVTGALGDALMTWSGREELYAWVVRSALDDVLLVDIESSIRELIADGTVTAHRAADDLISVLGTETAFAMRPWLRTDLYEPSTAVVSDDPCKGWKHWSREDCASCSEREDIPPHYLAQQVERYCGDPSFVPPAAAVNRLAQFVSELNGKVFSSSTWRTIDDHNLDQVEPILCRSDVPALQRLFHSALSAGFSRSGLSLRQFILFHFRERTLLVDDSHWTIAEDCWRRLNSLEELETEDARAESRLFGLLLPRWSARDQLERLLARDDNEKCLTDWERSFQPLTDWSDFERLLRTSVGEKRQRLIWFVGAQPSAIPTETVQLIASHLSDPDSFLRSLVMRILAQSPHAAVHIEAFASSPWSWSPSHHVDENHWGSVLLSIATNLAYSDIRRRIWPAYLGLAVKRRGMRSEDIQAYGTDLDQVWTTLPGIAPALATSLPQMRLSIESDSVLAPRPLVGISSEEFSRSIHFRSSDSFWGGTLDEDDKEPMESAFKGVSDEMLEQRQKAMGEALSQQWKVGNTWFGQRFASEALSDVIRNHPELLDKWSSPLLDKSQSASPFAQLAPSFYEALACASMEVQPEKGAALLEALESTGETIKTVWAGTEHRVLHFRLFKLPLSPALEGFWLARVKECRTDAELFSITLAAEAGVGGPWLLREITAMFQSRRLLDRAVSVTLAGFFMNSGVEAILEEAEKQWSEGWLRAVARKARKRRRSNQFAHHWYRQFATLESDREAWAAFRLFLRNVDSRFWWWKDKGELSPTRQTFLDNNDDPIERAIKENEKGLKESFAGQKVLEHECWPWMRDFEV